MRREICSEVAEVPQKLEDVRWDCAMKYGRIKCRVNTGSKLPADAAFLCDKVPATIAVLRKNKIYALCIISGTV